MSFTGARVAVKLSNGEFLSYKRNGSLTSVNCDDSTHEIIFYVPAALNNAYIQIHSRDLISVRDNGQLALKSNRENISENDLFDFICLGMNRVAIRAHNGKFVSFHPERNKMLCAGSDTIGPNETFEVIVIFR